MIGFTSRIMTYPGEEVLILLSKTRILLTAAMRRLSISLRYKTRASTRAFLHAFSHHPSETNETYFQHLWFTVKTSLRFVFLAALLFLHGVFPFLLTRTASSQIESIYRLMRSRIPQPRREAIENEYNI